MGNAHTLEIKGKLIKMELFEEGKIGELILKYVDPYIQQIVPYLTDLPFENIASAGLGIFTISFIYLMVKSSLRAIERHDEHANKMLDIKEEERSAIVEYLTDFSHRLSDLEERPDRTDEVLNYMKTMVTHDNNILNGVENLSNNMTIWIDMVNDGRSEHNKHISQLFNQFKEHAIEINHLTSSIKNQPEPLQRHALDHVVKKVFDKIDDIKIEIPNGDNTALTTLVELSKHYEELITKFNDILQVAIAKQTVELKEELKPEEFPIIDLISRISMSLQGNSETIGRKLDNQTGLLASIFKEEIKQIPEPTNGMPLEAINDIKENIGYLSESLGGLVSSSTKNTVGTNEKIDAIIPEIHKNKKSITNSHATLISCIKDSQKVETENIINKLQTFVRNQISDTEESVTNKNIQLQEELAELINDLDDSVCQTLRENLNNVAIQLDNKEEIDLDTAVLDLETIIKAEVESLHLTLNKADTTRKGEASNALVHTSQLMNAIEEQSHDLSEKIGDIKVPKDNTKMLADMLTDWRELADLKPVISAINNTSIETASVINQSISSLKTDIEKYKKEIINNIPNSNTKILKQLISEHQDNINSQLKKVEENVSEQIEAVGGQVSSISVGDSFSEIRDSNRVNHDAIISKLDGLTINQTMDNIETLVGTDIHNMHHEIILFLEQLKERLPNA